jgi:hypothetical protein
MFIKITGYFFLPVSYVFLLTRVNTFKPVFVVVFLINSLISEILDKITLDNERVICGKTLCSIGFHFDVYGG